MKRIVAVVLLLMLLAGCSKTTVVTVEKTPDPTAEPTPTPMVSAWETSRYADKFGDPVGDPYVYTVIHDGTFNNSVGSGMEMECIFVYDGSPYSDDYGLEGFFRFSIYEYGRSKAIHTSSDLITVAFKIGDEKYEEEIGYIKSGNIDSDIVFAKDDFFTKYGYRTDFNVLYDALNAGKTVQFVISIGSSDYSFTVNGTGFADAVKSAGW